MTVQIIVGNSLEKLRAMPDKSVHMVVTSPPYWGLRDYGIEPTVWGGDFKCEHVFSEEKSTREIRKGIGLEALSQQYRGGGKKAGAVPEVKIDRGDCKCGAWRGVLGLEPSPDQFVDHMVALFEEVRRVLRDDGTLWLNLGDTYAGSGRGGAYYDETSTLSGGQNNQKAAMQGKRARAPQEIGKTARDAAVTKRGNWKNIGLKPKDLVGIPWMVAFALRRAGWYLRQEIIWHKPNPMPESTDDRCTKAHEHIFLFSKSPDYFYDADAIKEDAVYANSGRSEGAKGSFARKRSESDDKEIQKPFRAIRETRNKRSVWTVATRPFAEAHFATFPSDLIEPCILAGTSERGCCPKCGTGWNRITAPTDRYLEYLGRGINDHAADHARGMMQQRGENRQNAMCDEGGIMSKETETLGWYPGCDCDGLEPLPDLPASPRIVREDGDFDRELTTAEKDQLEEKRAVWRRRCRRVYDQWRALCEPARGIKTKPAVVLDPFGGAGTTGLVADQNQRDAILIEMNPQYAAMAEKRIRKSVMPLFSVG